MELETGLPECFCIIIIIFFISFGSFLTLLYVFDKDTDLLHTGIVMFIMSGVVILLCLGSYFIQWRNKRRDIIVNNSNNV